VKIAMVAPYAIFPPDEGGRVRAYNLLKHLAMEHELVLFTPRDAGNALCDLPVKIIEATPAGRRHQILDAGFLRHALPLARAERPDVIVSEYAWPGLHAAYLAKRLGVPFALDAPNVEGERFRSTGSRVWRFVSAYERLITRLAASIFVVSAEDRERFEHAGVSQGKLQVVPNGVDPELVHPDRVMGDRIRAELGIGETTTTLLFFGQLGYAPNRHAVELIHDELLPRLERSGIDYVFVVAGKHGEELRRLYVHPKLRFTGTVETMAPYINAADVVVVPVLSGGGTRLKILESIACATPVVSTTVGAEGISRTACGDLLTVEDDWDSFTAALGSRRLVKRGNVPAPFLDMYSWATIVSRIEWPRR
jgi:glycosyltransferase involved in cell wall biosynthesis